MLHFRVLLSGLVAGIALGWAVAWEDFNLGGLDHVAAGALLGGLVAVAWLLLPRR